MLELIHLLNTGSLLFLIFLIIIRAEKFNKIANLSFSIGLISIFLLFLGDCFIILKLNQSYPTLVALMDIGYFAIAPTLFLSVKYFISIENRFQSKDLWHLVPAFLFAIYISIFIFSSNEWVNDVVEKQDLYYQWTIFSILFTLQTATYLFYSILSLYRHQRNIKLFASQTNSLDLNWLMNTLYGFCFLLFIWVVERSFPSIEPFKPLLYGGGIYYLGYYVLIQKEVFNFVQKEKEEIARIIEEHTHKKLKKKPTSNNERIEAVKTRLFDVMDKEKPYLDNEISLPKLASILQITTHELSFILNEELNENFFQFVNRYRIEESKELLKNEKYNHLSLIGIAYESGFNSKTVFNTTFKKLTGTTPSAFKKTIEK